MSNNQDDLNKVYKRGNTSVPINPEGPVIVNAGDPKAVWIQDGPKIIKKGDKQN
ncbi:MAG: hypothetical protein ACYDAJ_04860 [Nitrosotalea sp.]